MAERDGRTMNAMDDETKVVHARLERWGRWARDVGVRAWPESTLLARVIEEGPDGASIRSTHLAGDVPEDIAQVDAAVCHLGEIDRRVVRKFYLEWAPAEAQARSLRMRVAEFRAVLKRARFRVQGYLAALPDRKIN